MTINIIKIITNNTDVITNKIKFVDILSIILDTVVCDVSFGTDVDCISFTILVGTILIGIGVISIILLFCTLFGINAFMAA